MTPLRAVTIPGYFICVLGAVHAFSEWGLGGLTFGLGGLLGAFVLGLALVVLFAVVALFQRSSGNPRATMSRALRNGARIVGLSIPLIVVCYGLIGTASLILAAGSENSYVYLPIWLVGSGCVAFACGSMCMTIMGSLLSDASLDERGFLSFGASDLHQR